MRGCDDDEAVTALRVLVTPGRIGRVTDARQQLIDHISAGAVFHGDFTLTSGKKATYYVDLRKVSLDHRVAPLIGQVMLDLIAEIPDVVAVGGMTMGADPIAAAVLHQGAARGLSYDAFVVRKEPKDHGRGRQVEGPDLEGKRVIVLEDTSTTGGSPLAASSSSVGCGFSNATKPGISSRFSNRLIRISIRVSSLPSSGETKVKATPSRPMRPVRPTRCT